MKKFIKQVLSLILCFTILSSSIAVSVAAIDEAYSNTYCIHNAVSYAADWGAVDSGNTQEYERIPDTRGSDCTNFVSQCLVAGGMKTDNNWNSNRDYCYVFCPNNDRGYSDAYETFTNVNRLYSYLSSKGFKSDEYNANNGNIDAYALVGDIIQIYETNQGYHHSILCVGHDSNGEILYSAHNNDSNNKYREKISALNCIKTPGAKIRIIRMSNTYGMKEVTSEFFGKKIAIKSVETGKYVTSGTSEDTKDINVTADRDYASTWEYFTVESNHLGEAGFRANNGNYLSSMININSTSAPVRAAYGKNYSEPESYESFRIYQNGSNYYIQSQANGRWLQADIDNNNIVKASGKSSSTWERFSIEFVSGSANNTNNSTVEEETYVYDRYYRLSDYIKGTYTGEWKNGSPNGQGKLIYDTSDGKEFSVTYKNKTYYALYYEGGFLNGYRYGTGVVVYNDCFKDEGEFYGAWNSGKIIFKGKRYLKNEQFDGYWPITITASSNTSANDTYGDWCSLKAPSKETVTVVSTQAGIYDVTIPANIKLNVSNSPTDLTDGYYFDAKNSSYHKICTKKYTLSNGIIRYCFEHATKDEYWYFTFKSPMTVSEIKPSDVYIKSFKLDTCNYSDGIPQGVKLLWDFTNNSQSTILICPYIEVLNNDNTVISADFYSKGKSSGWILDVNEGYTYNIMLYALADGQNNDNDNYLSVIGPLSITIPNRTADNNDPGELSYLIKFDANGGTFTDARYLFIKSGDTAFISDKIPTRNGYTFSGWSEDANAVSPKYYPGSKIYGFKNMTLYAVWSSCESSAFEPTNISDKETQNGNTHEISKFNDSSYTETDSNITDNSVITKPPETQLTDSEDNITESAFIRFIKKIVTIITRFLSFKL